MSKIRIGVGNLFQILLFLILGLYLIIVWPDGVNYDVSSYYFILLSAYFIMGSIYILINSARRLYIFEPFVLVSIYYAFLFIFTPISDLQQGIFTEHGVFVWDGCIKATVLFLFCYIMFSVGYFCVINNVKIEKVQKKEMNNTSKITIIIIWFVSILFCLLHLVSQGFTLQYIFSFGSAAQITSTESSTVLFLSNFALSLISSWFIIFQNKFSKKMKIFTTIVTFNYLFIRGGRWLLLIMLSAPLIYFYVSKRKKPSNTGLASVVIVLMLLFSFVQTTRYDLKHGDGINFSGFTIEVILSPLKSDFGTYRAFYKLVNTVPDIMEYQYGKGMILYTLALPMPRILWNDKPVSPMHDVIETTLGPSARISGTALPNIGEYYYEFGVLGAMLFMFLFGITLSKIKSLSYSRNNDNIIMFSLLLPMLFQWVARGSFPHNLYSTLFLLIPVLLLKVRSNKLT